MLTWQLQSLAMEKPGKRSQMPCPRPVSVSIAYILSTNSSCRLWVLRVLCAPSWLHVRTKMALAMYRLGHHVYNGVYLQFLGDSLDVPGGLF